MNTRLLLIAALSTAALTMSAQAAFDAMKLSETELRGTSRSMSMAGAYTAVGGDISTLNQNPGGIGIYRSSDVGITMSLDFNKDRMGLDGGSPNKTNFVVNNIGYVGAMKIDSDILRNFNWGFSYNRINQFRRHYTGSQNLATSMSNYMADAANRGGWTENDLSSENNAYYSSAGAPWGCIGAYNSYMINPYTMGDGKTLFGGLMGQGTTGYGEYEVDEWGHTDEYSITLGGNFKNVVYWGMGVGITDLHYNSYTYYGEALNGSYQVENTESANIVQGNSSWGWENFMSTSGTGYNFKFGVILKPVNEFRIGLAFHTPTYYDLRDRYGTVSSYQYSSDAQKTFEGTEYFGGNKYADNETHYRLYTPWRFMAGVAGVIGKSGMISADYEYVGYQTLRLGDRGGYKWEDVTADVKDYFTASHILRVGGEYRVSPAFSLRAGYSYQTSPVKEEIKNGSYGVNTVSSNPSYRYDNTTQYITCGFGYRYKAFYLDMAYVHQARKGNYHAFSPSYWLDNNNVEQVDYGVMDEVKTHNNKVSLTLGVRF